MPATLDPRTLSSPAPVAFLLRGVSVSAPSRLFDRGTNLVDKKNWRLPISTRPLCPVCKKAVYSRGGIHPQCAMIQAESPKPRTQVPSDPAGSSPK